LSAIHVFYKEQYVLVIDIFFFFFFFVSSNLTWWLWLFIHKIHA